MFYRSNFVLSNESQANIIDYYKEIWSNHFPHRLETLPISWYNKNLGKEILAFLNSYNLFPYYTGLTVFLSNVKTETITNPHVDVLHKNTKLLPIKSRFNILCLGESGSMIWWNTMKWGQKDLVLTTFKTYTNIEYESYAIPGDDLQDRLEYLGDPHLIEDDILKPCSFVCTEYAHALKLSSGPRIVVSVGFDLPFENIKERINVYV